MHRVFSVALCLAAILLATSRARRPSRQPARPCASTIPSSLCAEGYLDLAPLALVGKVSFVAVYTSSAPNDPGHALNRRIRARLLAADGSPAGPEVVVSPGSADQSSPAVAGFGDGFVVVWREGTNLVLGRRFDAAATPLGDTFTVASSTAAGGLDVAASPDGSFLVVWAVGSGVSYRRFSASGQPLGGPVVLEAYAGVTGVDPRIVDPAVAADGNGGYAVVWVHEVFGFFLGAEVEGRRLRFAPLGGALVDELDLINEQEGFEDEPAAAFGTGGELVVVWIERDKNGQNAHLFGRWLGQTGAPGAVFRVDETDWWTIGPPDVEVDEEGRAIVVWEGGVAPSEIEAVHLRAVAPGGEPLGGQAELAPKSDAALPAIAIGESGALVAWQVREEPPWDLITPPGPVCWSGGLFAQSLATDCADGAESLCLAGGRFRVEVEWTDFAGNTGRGQTVPLTADTGAFWFFNAANVELVIKVLDGRPINDHFWVFYGALSNVGYRITVTDTATGAKKSYVNPPRTLASRADTEAFPAGVDLPSPASAAGAASSTSSGVADTAPAAASVTAAAEVPGPCSDILSPPTIRPGLCLRQEFEVTVDWRDPLSGATGVGHGTDISGDSGSLWFFNPSNVELVVKVLDGRGVNGRFWLFYGALSNVEYTIRVKHLPTGQERVYHNPPGTLASRADTEAFALP